MGVSPDALFPIVYNDTRLDAIGGRGQCECLTRSWLEAAFAEASRGRLGTQEVEELYGHRLTRIGAESRAFVLNRRGQLVDPAKDAAIRCASRIAGIGDADVGLRRTHSGDNAVGIIDADYLFAGYGFDLRGRQELCGVVAEWTTPGGQGHSEASAAEELTGPAGRQSSGSCG